MLNYPNEQLISSGGFRISRRGWAPAPRRLRFENFVFQNERIWTLWGGGVPDARPIDPPMISVD